jgi:hypothetical protein
MPGGGRRLGTRCVSRKREDPLPDPERRCKRSRKRCFGSLRAHLLEQRASPACFHCEVQAERKQHAHGPEVPPW